MPRVLALYLSAGWGTNVYLFSSEPTTARFTPLYTALVVKWLASRGLREQIRPSTRWAEALAATEGIETNEVIGQVAPVKSADEC